MKNYIKNILFHTLCILDGVINLLWSIFGGKVVLCDIASAFMLNWEYRRILVEETELENSRLNVIDDLKVELAKNLRKENSSEEDITRVLAELDKEERV